MIVFSREKVRRVDLSILICIPVTALNRLMMDFIIFISYIFFAPNIIISSTHNNCVRKTSRAIFIPLRRPFIFYFSMSFLRPSSRMRIRYKDNGKPCHRPLDELKEEDGDLLINTTIVN